MHRHILFALLACAFLLVLPAAGRAEEDVPATPSLDDLVDRVRNGTAGEFQEALRALSALGERAVEAVPALISNLDPPDDSRRARLSGTLAGIGAPAVPALTRGLMSWSGHTRVWCARTLGRMGASGAPAVPVLVESLADAHPELQLELLRALGGIGESAVAALPAVRKLLASRSGAVRVEAVRTLGRMGPDAVPLLIDLAASDDIAVAATARQALGRSVQEEPRPSPATLERLAERLRTGTETLRLEAARAIGVFGPRAASLLPALEDALSDESVHVRRAVIQALAALGPAAARTVDRLTGLLADDAAVRRDVIRALPFLGRTAEKAIPAIARLLQDGDVRLAAADALRRFGDAAVGQLSEAARHESFRVRTIAVRALGGTDRSVEGRLPALIEALEDESSAVRYEAAEGLRSLGAPAKPALSALRGRLADEVVGVRVAAARALFEVGERGAELAPALVEGLTSRTIVLFEDMDDRLVALGPAAVPALADAMARMWAGELAEVCARIGKPAIPALLRGLENPKPQSRRAALEGLREVEADGGFLLMPIAARLKDEDRTVRAAAARALVPFAKTCPEALVERVLPDLLAFFEREDQWSDEEAAVLEALEGIGEPALPALEKLVEGYDTDSHRGIRQLIQRIESAE